jgi:hypothetical protein
MTGAHNRADLIGRRFGRLTVLENVGSVRRYGKRWEANWLCKCDCGRLSIRFTRDLLTGDVRSCNCLARENLKSRRIDLTGGQFGRLTVVCFVDGCNRASWACRCSCGPDKWIIVDGNNLRRGLTRSCGCLRQGGRPSRKVEIVKAFGGRASAVIDQEGDKDGKEADRD